MKILLFLKKKGPFERLLDPNQKIVEILQIWSNEESSSPVGGGLVNLPNSGSSVSLSLPNLLNPEKPPVKREPPCFIFRKTCFFRNESLDDPVARNLTYIQVLHYIVESIYPCSIDEAVTLAGIQFHVIYGDHKDETHSAGFIEDKIKEYIPKNLLKEKKPKEWEALILKAHQKYRTTSDSELAYINYVKQVSYYGTEYFICKNTLNKKLPERVILGINAEGIQLMKKEQEIVFTSPWADLVSWIGTDRNLFYFEIIGRDQHPNTKYTFETTQGKTISQLTGLYVDAALTQTFKELFH